MVIPQNFAKGKIELDAMKSNAEGRKGDAKDREEKENDEKIPQTCLPSSASKPASRA